MAESVIRCSCPHCGGRLAIKDPRLVGKKTKCPKCQNAFVVEPAADEIEEIPPPTPAKAAFAKEDQREATARARKRAEEVEPLRDSGEDDEEDRPRKKKHRRDGDEDGEEDRPRKKKKKKKTSSGLLWAGVAGGVVVLAVAVVLVIWLLNRNPNQPGGGGGGLGDLLVDVSGPWPEVKPFRGINPPPEESSVTFHIVVVGVSYKNGGRDAYHDAEAEVSEKLEAVVKSVASQAIGRFGASGDDPSGRNRRMTVRVGPSNQEPKAFADRINFGTVRSVSGRTITVVVQAPEGPPANADAVAKALFRLKKPQSNVRHEAAEALKKLTPDQRRDEVARALEAALTEPDQHTREQMIDALGVWGTKETVPLLLQAMNQKEGRAAAIRALGNLKDERAIDPIAELLAKNEELGEVGDALKKLGPAAEKAVLKQLNHEVLLVRWKVCEILQAIGTKTSLPELEKVAKDLGGPADQAITAIKGRS
jgi:hypothetical protein